jgi:hypothetical protein
MTREFLLRGLAGLPQIAGRTGFRVAALAAAIILYGAAGSPTPDNPGMVEALTGGLLILGAGPPAAASFLSPRAPWQKAALALALYGLTVPVLSGLVSGSGFAAMVRDLVPFLFLLLPFFMTMSAATGESSRFTLTAAVVLAGMLFAVRVAAPFLAPDSLRRTGASPDPLYLANAPTVLFAALLLTGLAGRELYTGAGTRRLIRAAALAVAAFPPLAATVLVTQRASMGIIVLYIVLFLMLALIRSPARAVLPLLALIILIMCSWTIDMQVLHGAVEKTELVGVNMRWQEAAAVFDRLGDSFPSILFGRGWGAMVASPAVGGMTVNFTHSLLTSYWLKTGLCGLALVLLYLFRLGVLLTRLMRVEPLLAAALAGPLLIDVFLYASFKSLDFGLLLLLIPLWASAAQKLRQKPEEYSIAGDFQ